MTVALARPAATDGLTRYLFSMARKVSEGATGGGKVSERSMLIFDNTAHKSASPSNFPLFLALLMRAFGNGAAILPIAQEELQLSGGSGKLHLLLRAAVRRMSSFLLDQQDFCRLSMVIAPLSSAIVESHFLFSSKAGPSPSTGRSDPCAESIGTMPIRTILTTTHLS